ncbi:MAG: TonB-dependent receptor [Alteraurantiacibacter sp.]
MGNARKFSLVAGLLGSTMLAGTPVLAQDTATAEAPADNVIVVTSQRREQDLQDVPISVQVLGNEQLENLQVSDFEDYVKFLPSVSTQNFGGPFSQLVYMRGVASGGDGNHSGPMPSVGTYLDEQPITTAQGNLNVHLYDIARVEALAGPQGTLFGASSQAGTIRIITNKADPSAFDMSADVELNRVSEGDYGGSVEGMLNVPLNDMVAARLVGWYVGDAGYIDNVRVRRTYPTSGATDDNGLYAEDNFNDVETYGARLALGIELDDNWTFTPTIMAQRQRANGSFAYNPRLGGDLNTAVYRDNYGKDEWYQAALSIEGKIGDFDLVYSGAYLERTIEGLTDYSDYSYFYDTEAGYGTYFVGDCPADDYTCAPINPSQYIRSVDRFDKVSNELRVSTEIGDSLRVQVGAFHQLQRHNIQQRYMIDGLASFLEVTGWQDTIWLTKQEREDHDAAVFGQAELDITDQLTLTGGLRYFRYNNTLVGFFGYSNGNAFSSGEKQCFAPSVVVGAPCTNLGSFSGGAVQPARSKDDGLIHRLNLTFNATPDNMFYATWSRGFRPGGSNRRGGFAYGADFLTNYELGMKHTLFDGMVRWNMAVFQQDWNNFQFAILGPNGLTEIRNAAQARIRGVESDITFTPTDGFTLGVGGTYLDAELSDNYCGETDAAGVPVTNCAAPLAAAGTQLPASPDFKGNVIARYEFDGADDLRVHVQLAGVYQTQIRTELQDADDAFIGRQAGYGTIDFAVGVENEEQGWTAELFATNLLDERGTAYQYTQCFISVCANPTNGVVYQVPNQPATIGVKFGFDY